MVTAISKKKKMTTTTMINSIIHMTVIIQYGYHLFDGNDVDIAVLCQAQVHVPEHGGGQQHDRPQVRRRPGKIEKIDRQPQHRTGAHGGSQFRRYLHPHRRPPCIPPHGGSRCSGSSSGGSSRIARIVVIDAEWTNCRTIMVVVVVNFRDVMDRGAVRKKGGI